MTTRDEGAECVARSRVSTALGDFMVEASDRGVRAVAPVAGEGAGGRRAEGARLEPMRGDTPADHHAHAAAEALRLYAEGRHVRYDGPLDVAGPALHLAVWERLRDIPFGATTTYGAIAAALGMPGEARAVGTAVAANPVCVLVPCHRVVAADGSLRGFAWGLDLKRRLLAHEGSGALSLFPETLAHRAPVP